MRVLFYESSPPFSGTGGGGAVAPAEKASFYITARYIANPFSYIFFYKIGTLLLGFTLGFAIKPVKLPQNWHTSFLGVPYKSSTYKRLTGLAHFFLYFLYF